MFASRTHCRESRKGRNDKGTLRNSGVTAEKRVEEHDAKSALGTAGELQACLDTEGEDTEKESVLVS